MRHIQLALISACFCSAMACSDDSDGPTSPTAGGDTPKAEELGTLAARLSTKKDLPDCDDSNDGALYYLTDDEAFRVCDDGAYETVDLSGTPGDEGEAGPAGAEGETGPTGETGTDGATGSAGTDGATGTAGTDGTDGAAGTDGATGAPGPAGTDGAPGAAGADALATLLMIEEEAAGTNCPFGGQRIDVGPDQNSDGSLQTDEVSESRYVCNGETSPGGNFISGWGEPEPESGVDGDYYFDESESTFWVKEEGEWAYLRQTGGQSVGGLNWWAGSDEDGSTADIRWSKPNGLGFSLSIEPDGWAVIGASLDKWNRELWLPLDRLLVVEAEIPEGESFVLQVTSDLGGCSIDFEGEGQPETYYVELSEFIADDFDNCWDGGLETNATETEEATEVSIQAFGISGGWDAPLEGEIFSINIE